MLSSYHRSVLVDEVVTAFAPLRPGTVLDATVGGAGHALALLSAFPEATLLGTDRDPSALKAAEATLRPVSDRVRLVQATLDTAVSEAGVIPGTLSGVLLDLGVSGHQLDADDRGFTFRRGADLDMRMDRESGGPSAADFLQDASRDELAQVFREYGDVPRAGRLASAIVRRREREPMRTSDDLVGALSASLDRSPSNGEIESLERALPILRDALAPEGTFCVIAYHSVEDRAVKNAFREWSRDCVCPPGLPICACRGKALGKTLTRKPTNPSAAEIEANPRARSAHLRVWRKAA